jgi:L-ribulose-5-phosphate 3-epimerase UlaE
MEFSVHDWNNVTGTLQGSHNLLWGRNGECNVSFQSQYENMKSKTDVVALLILCWANIC